jgi:hypothetical protein
MTTDHAAKSAEHLLTAQDYGPPPDPWNTHDAMETLCAELPAINWICADLDIGPGRPSGVYSKVGVGKTTEVLDLCCAVATGTKAFQRFQCRRGRVAFITYDVGFAPTATRLRQIANGRKHSREELRGQIEVLTFPSVYLNSPNAEALFIERFAGYAFVVVDCFRDSVPGAKENESEIGAYLKMLARLSEQGGTTYAYLHHSQKGETADPLDVGRGSSAIRGASGAIWTIEGSGGSARLFTHARTHDCSVRQRDPFVVELTTLPPGQTFPTEHPSILLTARSRGERNTDEFFQRVEANKAAARERQKTLLALLSSHPNSSLNDLRRHVAGTTLGGKDALKHSLEDAIEDGVVVVSEATGRGGKRHVYALAPGVSRD